MVALEKNARTILAGGLGSLVGLGVLFTQNITNVIWVGGVLTGLTLVTVVGIARRYDEGFTEPLAGIVFVLSLSSIIALYAFTQLALVGYPRFTGVGQSVGESVYDGLRLYIVPALGTAVVVEFILIRWFRGNETPSSG